MTYNRGKMLKSQSAELSINEKKTKTQISNKINIYSFKTVHEFT